MARRLLPIRFQLIPDDQRRSETEIRTEVDSRRGRIWADVLTALARVQDAWLDLKAKVKPSHSLADFSVFGELLATSELPGSPGEWRALMQRLESAQGRFTTEEDPLVELLRQTIPSKGLPATPTRLLYAMLRQEADVEGLPLPVKSVGALTKALKNKRPALERALGVRIILDNHHQGGEYHVAIARMPGPGTPGIEGGDSGDGGDEDPISLSENPDSIWTKPHKRTLGSQPSPPSQPTAEARRRRATQTLESQRGGE